MDFDVEYSCLRLVIPLSFGTPDNPLKVASVAPLIFSHIFDVIHRIDHFG